jgi:signal recognition particle subunit SRP54
MLREQMKKKVLLVSCDVYRPAAIEQLKALAAQAEVDFFPSATGQKPVDIALAALDFARRHYHEVLIADTAGRLAIDVEMMREITELNTALKPIETLFVVDSMQGQDAVNVARAFSDALPLTGIVLTKLDGTAKGGVICAIAHLRSNTAQQKSIPLRFVGVGETLEDLRPFNAEEFVDALLG